jgi:glycolate dehydrogenase FAD-binding subunit
VSASPATPALQPATLEAVQEHVHAALAAGEALEVLGGGSKRGYGRPVQAARSLSLAALRGIVDYQPHELILVARPGTPLAELEAVLAEAGQALAFEPPHWGEAATLGGAIACNLSGPRRFKAGAARDHLLGFQAVTGTGEVVRGGGRVVKNVTGYDLPKLMCGSFGTLAVLTELVVKVLPRAETECTVIFAGLDDAAAVAQLGAAARSQLEPSGLAHLPATVDAPRPAAQVAEGVAVTAVRVEGPEPSVRLRAQRLAAPGAAGILEDADSRAFWAALRELEPLEIADDERLWRFSLAPTAGPGLGRRLAALGEVRHCYDWGGALLWAAVPAPIKPPALHELAREFGGHAQLVRQGADCPREEPAFSALSGGQRQLNANLKQAFDPQRVLNPGRMYADL